LEKACEAAQYALTLTEHPNSQLQAPVARERAAGLLRAALTPKPEGDPIAELGAAVEQVNREHPLPRCAHGKALADGAGEKLEPPCGCRLYGKVRP